MTGGSHIRAIGPEGAQDANVQSAQDTQEEPLSLEPAWEESWVEDEAPAKPRFTWVMPALAFAAVAGWTGFYVWALREVLMAGGTPTQWVGWIINWSVPVLLVITLWLLAMRTSHREAGRFADMAAQLSREAAQLETRLLVINRELSLAREFLGSQSLELESLGRVASERLSTHAQELKGLIHSNGQQIDSIASVSDTALQNMQKLRDDLPVIANSARDVSNQVGNAGRTAHEQLDKLIGGFQRLNEFGVASERQVNALTGTVKETLDTFEQQVASLDQLAEQRFTALKQKSEEFRVDLDGREIDALAAMRHRADELKSGIVVLREQIEEEEAQSLAALRAHMQGLRSEERQLSEALRDAEASAYKALEEARDRLRKDIASVITDLDRLDEQAIAASQQRIQSLRGEANRFDELLAARDIKFNEDIARRQDAFDTRESQASEVLAQRLAQLDETLAERREAQMIEIGKLASHGETIAIKVGELNALFQSISEQADNARERLGMGIGDLSGKLAENRSSLAETGETLDALTESSVRLLEIIQSGAKQSREELPHAIENAESRLGQFEQRAALLRDTIADAGKHGSDLSNYLIETQGNIESATGSIEQLGERISFHSTESLERVRSLQEALTEVEAASERVSASTRDELQSAIERLVEASRHAFVTLESSSNDVIEKAAEKVAGVASQAIQRSMLVNSTSAIGEIEQASSKAAESGRNAAIQLRDQLAKVNELANNLEQRVSRARELAEERVDNDFARRMALITESLNSNAIDISKAFSGEVSDSAWASYLKGDRGIFTRRAVRLIENSEAREIVDLYQRDDEFREHVSRYIHDFEGMLRMLLSTRDGNALGVTVLGSDMGKLYVALAQAIDRLRN